MKLRKAIKLGMASAAVALPGLALSAPPAAFNQWSVDSTGNIAATCAAGFTCSSTPVTDSGFLQRTISNDATGDTYIQTILTDGLGTGDNFNALAAGGTATAGFADENFVKMGAVKGGLSDRSAMREIGTGLAAEEVFTSNGEINTGDFMVMGSPMITFDQSVFDATGPETFNNGFNFQHGMNMSGMVGYDGKYAKVTLTGGVTDATLTTDFKLEQLTNEDVTASMTTAAAAAEYKKIDQSATLDNSGFSLEPIVQQFVLNERTGAAVASAGTMTNTASGLSTTFAAGDTIVSLRLGSQIDGAGTFGLHDSINETASTGVDQDSQTSIPFPTPYTVTQYNTGGDPFASF